MHAYTYIYVIYIWYRCYIYRLYSILTSHQSMWQSSIVCSSKVCAKALRKGAGRCSESCSLLRQHRRHRICCRTCVVPSFSAPWWSKKWCDWISVAMIGWYWFILDIFEGSIWISECYWIIDDYWIHLVHFDVIVSICFTGCPWASLCYLWPSTGATFGRAVSSRPGLALWFQVWHNQHPMRKSLCLRCRSDVWMNCFSLLALENWSGTISSFPLSLSQSKTLHQSQR